MAHACLLQAPQGHFGLKILLGAFCLVASGAMNLAHALAIVSALTFAAVDSAHAAPEPSVAAAQKNLDAARANLAKAVSRIEKDPPSTQDLEAAHEAVA